MLPTYTVMPPPPHLPPHLLHWLNCRLLVFESDQSDSRLPIFYLIGVLIVLIGWKILYPQCEAHHPCAQTPSSCKKMSGDYWLCWVSRKPANEIDWDRPRLGRTSLIHAQTGAFECQWLRLSTKEIFRLSFCESKKKAEEEEYRPRKFTKGGTVTINTADSEQP